MASKKKRNRTPAPQREATPPLQPEIKPARPRYFPHIVTGVFFVVALWGMLNHEMWRDEHQAWLVARDAASLPQLFENMRYEGNPALWHFFLFLITRFTHNPAFMQALSLLFACGYIFLFNRYAPLSRTLKILFTFGYFALYEYAIISRSYGLGILLLFSVCALYERRTSHYVLIGLLLALAANVTIYALLLAGAMAGVMLLDYIFYQEKSRANAVRLAAGLSIFGAGVAGSLWQIWPDKSNSFPVQYATQMFDLPRWGLAASRLVTTYFHIPRIQEEFWNTHILFDTPVIFRGAAFTTWLGLNSQYVWSCVALPVLILVSATLMFLRKPMVLLLWAGTTAALLSLYYYTVLLYVRYCGYLLVALMIGCWLAELYPEKRCASRILSTLTGWGRRMGTPFLAAILFSNVLGAVVACWLDYRYPFSASKEAVNYIKANKLDKLPIVGTFDFALSPFASDLNTKIYYPQMGAFGSFTIWSRERKDNVSFQERVESVKALMDEGHTRLLMINNHPTQMTYDGRNYRDVERLMLRSDIQLDLLTNVQAGVIADETYYIYLIQKIDPSSADYSRYIRAF